MAEINLLNSLPKGKRSLNARKDKDLYIEISKKFGQMYFDGPREYGYGGYKYDGRWKIVAKDIISHFNLKKGDKLLDVGCAKGFLVKDLLELGIDAYGIDVSEYAILNCEPEVIGRLQIGSADSLPFPDNSFNAVVAINSIHNLSKEKCIKAVKEIERISPGKGFIQVDSYHTEIQKQIFESWVLTAEFYDYPDGWVKLFYEAGYTGDWYWTIFDSEGNNI